MLNPVLVRDCRQMVRSRFVVIMISLFLAGMVFAVYNVFLAGWNFHERDLGRALFGHIIAITAGGTLVTVLLSSIGRIWTENTEPDPMFISLLKPRQIVTGKLLGGVVVSTLFYCMALPFLSLVYLLRGVDIIEIALAMLGSFLLIQSVHAACLAFFCGAKTLPRFVVMGVLFLPLGMYYTLFAAICGVASWDVARSQAGLIYAISALIAWAFFFVPGTATLLAIAQYSPPSTNRMFATRLFITVCGLLLLPAVIVTHIIHDQFFGRDVLPLVFLLSIGGMVVMIFMNLIAICERDESSWRTRHDAPKWLLLRILKFPLSSGSLNAFCWTFLSTTFLVIATLLIAYNFLPIAWQRMAGPELPKTLFGFAVFTLFVFNYSATAYILHRLFLARWVPREWAWLMPLGLLVCVAIGTYIVGALIDPKLYSEIDFWRDGSKSHIFQSQILLAPNPMTVFVDMNGYRYAQIACAFLWANVLGLIGFMWCIVRFAEEERRISNAEHAEICAENAGKLSKKC